MRSRAASGRSHAFSRRVVRLLRPSVLWPFGAVPDARAFLNRHNCFYRDVRRISFVPVTLLGVRRMIRTSVSMTALGMVNALGCKTAAIWKRLQAGDQSGLSLEAGYLNGGRVRVGQVKVGWPSFPRALKRYECRNNALTLVAYRQIELQVQKALKQYGSRRVGVVMGSSTSGMATTESAFTAWRSSGQFPPAFGYVQHEMGGLSQFLAYLIGSKGPPYPLPTASSSSAKVLASALALIHQD